MKTEIKREKSFQPVTLTITANTQEEYDTLTRFFRRSLAGASFYIQRRSNRRLHPSNLERYEAASKEYPLLTDIVTCFDCAEEDE